jgi:hypothetical protein
MKVHIVLQTKHDTNGNPRRVSLLMDQDIVLQTVDHGYAGRPRDWPHPAATIDVLASEYKWWKAYRDTSHESGGDA